MGCGARLRWHGADSGRAARVKRATLQAILEAAAEKRAIALVTALDSNEQALVYGVDSIEGDLAFAPDVQAAAREALANDRSATKETSSGPVFVQVFNPPLRMFVVGAVHISQALAPIAAVAGYDVTLVDPRRAFASHERFPEVAITHEWPDEALSRLAPDRRTAVVTLSHDPKLDDAALSVALRSEAFYIGSLGSRKTHARRLERLREAGFSESELTRIHGPVGLPLGAQSPAEIAVSILAQSIRALRQGSRAAS